MQERASAIGDDTTAFAASPPSVPTVPVSVPAANPSLTPSLSPRKCEGCEVMHGGTYGSGRFCSATCAKKVGARHKWAARVSPGASRRPGPARRAVADAPCESCTKLHDRSYGSGRFCSVHCARRVAATRKWEKSRSEKNKRLEAIRPAMLAPPPPPSPLAGKRRRVVGRGMEAVSDHGQSFFVTGTTYTVNQPVDEAPATHAVLAPAPIASYIPPAPQTPIHYHQLPTAAPADSAVIGQRVVYASHTITANASAPHHSALLYGQPAIPAYRVVHTPTPAVDTAGFSLMTQSPSPPRATITQHCQQLQYAPPSSLERSIRGNYGIQGATAFDMEAIPATVSLSQFDDAHDSKPLIPSLPQAGGLPNGLQGNTRQNPAKSAEAVGCVEGSESAARALLCLRATNS